MDLWNRLDPGYVHIVDGKRAATDDARLLARPILQEYDASTVDELGVNPAEFGNLAARHILVEIAEACRREADACTMEPPPVRPTCGNGN